MSARCAYCGTYGVLGRCASCGAPNAPAARVGVDRGAAIELWREMAASGLFTDDVLEQAHRAAFPIPERCPDTMWK